MPKQELTFSGIAEAPGLEQRDVVIAEIRGGLPFMGKTDARLGGRESLVEEGTLVRSLAAAYKAGALGVVATMQTTLAERDIEVDLTRELVNAHIAAEWGLLPIPEQATETFTSGGIPGL